MTRRTRWIGVAAACLGLAAAAGCKDATGEGGKRGGAGRRAAAPYDVGPLLVSLRPAERARLAGQLGLKDLGQLPLYDMDLALDPAGARLAGSYVLHYRNATGRPLARLPLLLHPNAPGELGVKEASGGIKVTGATAVKGPAVTLEPVRPTLVRLRFARPVAPGRWVAVKVTFEGTLRQLPASANDIFSQALSSLGVGSSGSGASDYGLLASGDGLTTLASAYPMAAPHRRDGFDEDPPTKFGDLAYNELVNFRVRTVLPRGYTLVSNLVELPGVKALPSGQPVVTSVGAANRDLVLVAGQGLRRQSRRLGPIRVSSVSLPGDAAAGARILKDAADSLALFQRRFGPYPYTELDVAEASLVGGAGGVEFPGMVLVAGMFYRKPSRSNNPLAMLSRMMGSLGGLLGGGLQGGGAQGGGGAAGQGGGLASMDQMIKTMAAFTVSHEVAHQYFAGLVGTDCRVDPSVDEPLAQFAAGEYMKQVHGEVAGQRLMDLNVKANYGIYRMLGGADLPAAQPVRRFPTALAYAAIVYGKAPYFYIELRRRLGAWRFDQALRAAVDASRFRMVTLQGWIGALQKGAGGSPVVGRLARRYFHGRHGDADLGVDESGDAVLALLLGQQVFEQLKQGLGRLGMHPRALFRMLMGQMAQGGGPSAGGGVDPLDALQQLQRLGQ